MGIGNTTLRHFELQTSHSWGKLSYRMEKSPSPFVCCTKLLIKKCQCVTLCNLQHCSKCKTHLFSFFATIYIAVIWANLQEDCRIRIEFSDLLVLIWFAMSESDGHANPVEEIECLDSHEVNSTKI